MQHIIMQCFQAVKAKLDCKLGYFDLIGCDFLIEEDFKVRHKKMVYKSEICVYLKPERLTESDTAD